MCIHWLIGTSPDMLFVLMLTDLDQVMTYDQVDLGHLLFHLQLASDAESRCAAAAATAVCVGAATAGGATWLILAEVWKIGRYNAEKDPLQRRFGDRAR